jgi:hypothetical protein
MDKRLSEFTERGYHPYMIMLLENGATDMLPMDLQSCSADSSRSFTFDWRTYFCTLFHELKTIDARGMVRLATSIPVSYVDLY